MHPQTLRKYERAGLLKPRRRNGYRRTYSQADLVRLAALRDLSKRRGVNVAGLQVLMDVLEVVERIERALDLDAEVQAARLRAEIARLRRLLAP